MRGLPLSCWRPQGPRVSNKFSSQVFKSWFKSVTSVQLYYSDAEQAGKFHDAVTCVRRGFVPGRSKS